MQASDLLVIGLGLDSFLAGLVLGPVMGTARGSVILAVMFGACDGAAIVLGARWPHALPDFPSAVLYAVVVCLVLLAARHSKAWLFLAPLILSLDNLASGAAPSAAPIIAGASAAMAMAGMAVSWALLSARRRA